VSPNKYDASNSFFLKTVIETSDERECSANTITEELKDNFLDRSDADQY